MALYARGRVDPAVDLVLTEIVTPVRKRTFRRIGKLVAGLDFFLVRMAVDTERFLMASGACLTGSACVKAVFFIKIGRLVIHGAP